MSPLLVIVGQTASGKSALALELAKRLNGELICADSWTVYENFDIGTAKPSLAERRKVRHHLLDVADPAKGFSAPLFQRLANAAIVDIHSRGKIPIMVGGTGLYIDSVIYNYSFLPAPPDGLRDQLNDLSLVELVQKAKELKLPTNKIDIRNKRRVIRLIENGGQNPTRKSLRSNTIVLGIKLNSEELSKNIHDRVDRMLSSGLEGEVAKLADENGWSVEPMKGIGYKEFRDYFNGLKTKEETKLQIIRNTLALGKRQSTWFKRNNSIHWLNNRYDIDEIVDFVTTKLNK